METVKMRLLLLFVPLLFAMLLMSACSPYTSQSKVATPPPTAKQCYLVLPPDEVKYLFLLHISSITPDEYASWAGNIYRSSTVEDIGRGDWLISASWGGTSGTWKLTQEPPFEFVFLRHDAGANNFNSLSIAENSNDSNNHIMWAVGNSGEIIRYDSLVQGWSQGTGDASFGNLNSVSFFDDTTGWAVGDNGTILRYDADLDQWFEISSGTGENLNGVFMYSKDEGYIVGESGTVLKIGSARL